MAAQITTPSVPKSRPDPYEEPSPRPSSLTSIRALDLWALSNYSLLPGHDKPAGPGLARLGRLRA